ncbi:MAG: hypothetical protein SGILL_007014 [Bacillariaceae sp.]
MCHHSMEDSGGVENDKSQKSEKSKKKQKSKKEKRTRQRKLTPGGLRKTDGFAEANNEGMEDDSTQPSYTCMNRKFLPQGDCASQNTCDANTLGYCRQTNN